MSRFFKGIDLYGKLPKGLAEPTDSGAIVSVVTMVLLALMIMTEVIEYVSVDVNSDIFVDEETQQEKVHVNMNIYFPRLPCDFLDVDAYDAMGIIVKNDDKFLKFFRTTREEVIISQYTDEQLNVENIRRDIAEGNGCQVSGFIKVNKVPGKISFGAHRTHHQVNNILENGLVLDVSHKFNHLSFGDDADLSKVQKQFKQGQLSSLDGQARIKSPELKQFPIQHEHFINIVPTTFTLLNKQSYHVYQYTANHNEIRAQYYPQMILRYDVSPVTFKIWQTKEDILHFLVQICAIIGGIFTVSGMIESAIHKASMFTISNN